MERRHLKRFGRPLNLENPQGFNEKTQWYKLYYRHPLMPVYGDKWAARNYLSDLGYDGLLNEQYAAVESVQDIDWDGLPNRFVVKASHDSGGVAIVKDKERSDLRAIQLDMSRRMGRAYGGRSGEWYYLDIKPRILVQEYLEDASGGLRDYKVHCFGGCPRYIHVVTDRFGHHREDFFDLRWNRLPFSSKSYVPANLCPLPESPGKDLLEQMTSTSRELSTPFPYVRVDLFVVGTKLYFGEFTFFHSSGWAKWYPSEGDAIMGAAFELPGPDSPGVRVMR